MTSGCADQRDEEAVESQRRVNETELVGHPGGRQ